MKRSRILIAVIAFVGLSFWMSSSRTNVVAGEMDCKSKSMHGESGKMCKMNMSEHCQMMSSEMGELEEHFNKMMKMDNMKALKKEMAKHHEMMSSMHEKMSEHQKTCKHMMSMMQSRDIDMAPAMGKMAEGYTCPMHPKVESNQPGKCPECGMNLEKVSSE